jgi:prevent-host-death family protein
MREWSIREAKDRLSELVEEARRAPQAITKRGRRSAVVLSQEEFERLNHRVEPLVSFFARSGLGDVEIRRISAAERGDAEL